MKFIISRFSPKMIMSNNFSLDWRELTDDEFQAFAYDAYSCIGMEDVATVTGFAYNKEPVRARIGDTLLLADYDNGALVYWSIQVYPIEQPLYKEEYIEEMI